MNKSEIDFITSDHPVINIYGTFKDAELMSVNDLEIYYPLDSRLAMFLTNRDCYVDTDEIHATVQDVMIYNRCIYEQAEKFVYASNSELLEKMP